VRRAVLFGNECINTPIQGTAADIVIDSQNEVFELSQRLKDPFLQPRIQVHDDITFFLPDNEDQMEQYINQVAQILVKRRFPFISVPLMVEISIGYNWAEMSEICKIVGDYHR
jgi:DNA polymerase I-like protein with 3'-5' exonuclease and polymerase domains